MWFGICEADFLLLCSNSPPTEENPTLSEPVLKKSVSFSSVRSNIRLVESFILEINDALDLESSILDRIMISITEVVNNGIIHGNQSDPAKQVHLSCTCYEDRIDFVIRDEGTGFSPDDIPDPLDDENLLKEGGRGVLIVRSMMDSVRFQPSADGMEVHLSISRTES